MASEKEKGISIIIYSLDYDEFLEQCAYSVLAQKEMDIDVKVIISHNKMQDAKNKLSAISPIHFYEVEKGEFGSKIMNILEECEYDSILFVNSDTVLEGDTCSRMLKSKSDADALIFNISVSEKCNNVFENGLLIENILKNEIENPPVLSMIYSKYPTIWNHLFSRKKMLNNNLILKNMSRVEQYLFIVKYHSLCKKIAVNTDIYIYRDRIAEKKPIQYRYFKKNQQEIKSIIEWANKSGNSDCLKILIDDFVLTPYLESLKRVDMKSKARLIKNIINIM